MSRVLLPWILVGLSCTPGSTPPQTCEPGSSRACVCPVGEGIELCGDKSTYGQCSCPESPDRPIADSGPARPTGDVMGPSPDFGPCNEENGTLRVTWKLADVTCVAAGVKNVTIGVLAPDRPLLKAQLSTTCSTYVALMLGLPPQAYRVQVDAYSAAGEYWSGERKDVVVVACGPVETKPPITLKLQ